MISKDLLKTMATILDSKKAQDIKAINISSLSILADYFLLATGTSTTQVKSLADEVEFKLKQQGIMPQRIEGYNSGSWILLDYGDVVVHVFLKDTRSFYSLEHLWVDAEQVGYDDLMKDETATETAE